MAAKCKYCTVEFDTDKEQLISTRTCPTCKRMIHKIAIKRSTISPGVIVPNKNLREAIEYFSQFKDIGEEVPRRLRGLI